MKNTLEDLNDHLFAELERLDDESISDEKLDTELRRAEGMPKVGETILRTGELAYKSMALQAEYHASYEVPKMLEVKNGKEVPKERC